MGWKLGERVEKVPKRALANSDRTRCFYKEDPPAQGRDGEQRGPGLSHRLMWSARQGSTPLAKKQWGPPNPPVAYGWGSHARTHARTHACTHTVPKPAEYWISSVTTTWIQYKNSLFYEVNQGYAVFLSLWNDKSCGLRRILEISDQHLVFILLLSNNPV